MTDEQQLFRAVSRHCHACLDCSGVCYLYWQPCAQPSCGQGILCTGIPPPCHSSTRAYSPAVAAPTSMIPLSDTSMQQRVLYFMCQHTPNKRPPHHDPVLFTMHCCWCVLGQRDSEDGCAALMDAAKVHHLRGSNKRSCVAVAK